MSDIDYGLLAQQAAEEHLEKCFLALEAEDYDIPAQFATPWPDELLAPFCGCATCVVRETLNVAWPLITTAVLAAQGAGDLPILGPDDVLPADLGRPLGHR